MCAHPSLTGTTASCTGAPPHPALVPPCRSCARCTHAFREALAVRQAGAHGAPAGRQHSRGLLAAARLALLLTAVARQCALTWRRHGLAAVLASALGHPGRTPRAGRSAWSQSSAPRTPARAGGATSCRRRRTGWWSASGAGWTRAAAAAPRRATQAPWRLGVRFCWTGCTSTPTTAPPAGRRAPAAARAGAQPPRWPAVRAW